MFKEKCLKTLVVQFHKFYARSKLLSRVFISYKARGFSVLLDSILVFDRETFKKIFMNRVENVLI